jgi:hypothetical protein
MDSFDFEAVSKLINNKKALDGMFDAAGWRVLKDLGFDSSDVVDALKTLITIKAFSYHPHEAPNVRAAELENLYSALKEMDMKDG